MSYKGTTAEIELFKQLASEGQTRQEIADRTGLSYSRVSAVLHDNGIKVVRKKTVQPKRGPREQDLFHKQRDDQIFALRQQGYKQKAIAEQLGCTLDIVKNTCRKLEITEIQQPLSEKQVSETVSKAGFDYVGGFTNSHSKILVVCRECSTIFEIWYSSIRKSVNGVFGKIKCPVCFKREIVEQQEKQREKQQAQKELRHVILEQNRLIKESKKTNDKLLYLMKTRVCKNCGNQYSIQVTNYDDKSYCSKKCKTRWNNRFSLDKREKIIRSRKHDNDITLEKLYQMENGVCYLCGIVCNWDDIKNVDGTLVAGNDYPSIDHVKPLSRGGTHTWDNVRLACRICNSRKWAKL